jgi:pimeloyl-ACP methyl ester carboxylesterase
MKLVVAVLSIVLAASGCAKNEVRAQSREVARGPTPERPIVYLHGMCSDPKEDLAAWGHIAEQHGAVVTVMGDVASPDKPGQLKWSTDAAAIDAKVDEAVKDVERARGVRLDPSGIILVGESMGAARAELLATKFPDKYTRLVLVGSPRTPSPRNLGGVKAVANLAGEKERQSMMKDGTRALESAGTPSRFWELPEATHGNYGPDGERIMNEAIGFVASR